LLVYAERVIRTRMFIWMFWISCTLHYKKSTQIIKWFETYLSRDSEYYIWQIVLNTQHNCGILMFWLNCFRLKSAYNNRVTNLWTVSRQIEIWKIKFETGNLQIFQPNLIIYTRPNL
jgi:hypothetical protein